MPAPAQLRLHAHSGTADARIPPSRRTETSLTFIGRTRTANRLALTWHAIRPTAWSSHVGCGRAELAEQYGVARVTVRRAIALLRERGKVVTVHGRGSYVTPRPGPLIARLRADLNKTSSDGMPRP
jgi:Bacterial regulatory proteins, gntR family